MRKAQFNTDRVEYILEASGYSRNGCFINCSNLEIQQLGVGQSAIFSYTLGSTPYRIVTDPVRSIRVMPRDFISVDADAYRVRVQSKKNLMIRYKIGSSQVIAEWAAKKWPTALISLEPCRSGIYRAKAN